MTSIVIWVVIVLSIVILCLVAITPKETTNSPSRFVTASPDGSSTCTGENPENRRVVCYDDANKTLTSDSICNAVNLYKPISYRDCMNAGCVVNIYPTDFKQYSGSSLLFYDLLDHGLMLTTNFSKNTTGNLLESTSFIHGTSSTYPWISIQACVATGVILRYEISWTTYSNSIHFWHTTPQNGTTGPGSQQSTTGAITILPNTPWYPPANTWTDIKYMFSAPPPVPYYGGSPYIRIHKFVILSVLPYPPGCLTLLSSPITLTASAPTAGGVSASAITGLTGWSIKSGGQCYYGYCPWLSTASMKISSMCAIPTVKIEVKIDYTKISAVGVSIVIDGVTQTASAGIASGSLVFTIQGTGQLIDSILNITLLNSYTGTTTPFTISSITLTPK